MKMRAAALRSGKLAPSVRGLAREGGQSDALSSDGYVRFDDGQSSLFGFELKSLARNMSRDANLIHI